MRQRTRDEEERACDVGSYLPSPTLGAGKTCTERVPACSTRTLGVSTAWTPVAVRPAALDEVPATVLFRHEAALELSQGAREVGSGHGPNTLRDPRAQHVGVAESTG